MSLRLFVNYISVCSYSWPVVNCPASQINQGEIMAEQPVVKHLELEPPPQVVVRYTPETETLIIDTGKPWGDGEEIAKDLIAFYDQENNVVGFTIECAELLLKPFVDAVVDKQAKADGQGLHRADLESP